MTDNLSRGAAALVHEGRRALRPTDADKARILVSLRDQLATGRVYTRVADSTGVKGATAGAGLGKLAALTAGFLAVVAAFVALSRPEVNEPSKPVSQPASSSAPAFGVDPVEVLAASEPRAAKTAAEVPAAVVFAAPSTRGVRRGEGSDRLAEEVALLTRVERDFHAGNFARALAGADEHRRKFPMGTLTREREDLSVRALCGLGCQDEARAEAKRLGALASEFAKLDRACPGGR